MPRTPDIADVSTQNDRDVELAARAPWLDEPEDQAGEIGHEPEEQVVGQQAEADEEELSEDAAFEAALDEAELDELQNGEGPDA